MARRPVRRCVLRWHVVHQATTKQVDDDECDDQRGRDDSEHLDPSWNWFNIRVGLDARLAHASHFAIHCVTVKSK